MQDSLERIQKQPREIWLVKLADRAANLNTPPRHWGKEKIRLYAEEGAIILHALGDASVLFSARLADRIAAWRNG